MLRIIIFIITINFLFIYFLQGTITFWVTVAKGQHGCEISGKLTVYSQHPCSDI